MYGGMNRAVVEVIYTDEFGEWYDTLDAQVSSAVDHKVEMLARFGVTLGYPHSSAVHGSTYGLRELRVQRAIRVLYTFDPRRDALLLIGRRQVRRCDLL